MSPKKWKSIGTSTVDREITPFDLLDRWGRWVGYEIDVREVFWVEAPETSAIWSEHRSPFVAFTYNTRDSNHYGPSVEPIWGDSQAEVMTKARKRRAGARKRQEKNWSELNEPRRRSS